MEDLRLKILATDGSGNPEYATISVARFIQLLNAEHPAIIVITIHKFQEISAELTMYCDIRNLLDSDRHLEK